MYTKFSMFREKIWAWYVKYFRSYWLLNMWLFECIRGLLSENALAVNVLTSSKTSWNPQKSAFIWLFHHSVPNWVGKYFFQSDLRFLDFLLTRWLSTTSILVVIERIYRYQFKSNYVKNEIFFAAFSLTFCYLH